MPATWLRFIGACCIACATVPSVLGQDVGGKAASHEDPPARSAMSEPTQAVATVVTATMAAAAAGNPAYLLQPGDILTIGVWKETELTAEVLVRPDGGISFPLAGELPAANRTVADLTALLEKRIRKLEPDAVVTVVVKSAGGNRVYVIGKVNRPGDFALIGPTDVMQALTLAGGATVFANTNAIRILRREGERQSSIGFRYGDVEHGRRLSQNILLKSGDTVVVP